MHDVAGILDTRRPSAAAATVPVWNGNPESLRVNVTGLSPAATPYEVANGSTVTGLSGVMDYNTSEGQFQLYTDAAGAGTPSPLTPALSATPVPAALSSDLTIGNFNMERFYNDTAEGNGAVTLTTAAYQGRLNKASLAIRNVMRMPDIIGLEEVEGQRNSSGSQPVHVIDDIVNKVNADAVAAGQGNPNYTYCIGLTNDPGAITPAIIYKQSKVQITECLQYGLDTQYNEPGGGTNLLNDRAPTTIRANVTATGSDSSLAFRVVVNHLRSLNGIDEPGATNGDRVRSKRNDQAKYLANLINGTSGDHGANWNLADNLIVVGDFNAFYVNDGYADVMNCITGNPAPANQQFFTAAQLAVGSPCTPILNPPLTNLTNLDPAAFYSYSFAGTIQTLDHVLLNTKAYGRYRQLVYARNDADFPEGPTYRNNFNRPERVSDHDMPVLYLRLPVEVTSRTRVNASAVVQNRATGRFTSNISVTNTGSAALTGPVYVFFSNLTPGVTLPDLPTYNGQPYATINLGAEPGARRNQQHSYRQFCQSVERPHRVHHGAVRRQLLKLRTHPYDQILLPFRSTRRHGHGGIGRYSYLFHHGQHTEFRAGRLDRLFLQPGERADVAFGHRHHHQLPPDRLHVGHHHAVHSGRDRFPQRPAGCDSERPGRRELLYPGNSELGQFVRLRCDDQRSGGRHGGSRWQRLPRDAF